MNSVPESGGRFDFCALRECSIFWDDNDSILDDPIVINNIGADRKGADNHTWTEPGVFVYDGTLDVALGSDTDGRFGRIGFRIIQVIVRPH